MTSKTVIDFISGETVRATPEEVHAVQVFAKILVSDYGYPRSHIRTHPQWRVKARPSDVKREYPIDIAVFSSDVHTDEELKIIVECKQPNRRSGHSQLMDYMRFSEARVGVWFNGNEKLYLKKSERKGKVLFEEIPNIPKFGERLEDIGLYRRRDLRPARNLKSVFKTIRNYLAANAVGITRDEVFAQQIINLIFCKIYDERFTRPDDMVRFRAGLEEPADEVMCRIEELFCNVKSQYGDVIEPEDTLILDQKSLAYIVGELHLFSLTEANRDAIGEAFETFIGPSLKGGQGQFFTPRNVVNLLVTMTELRPRDKVIDPACGSGGFLIEALRDIWQKVEIDCGELGWPDHEISAEKQRVAIRQFRGIDKDYFLAKVAKAYMAIVGDGRGGVYCENSLENLDNWDPNTRQEIYLGSFDVVLTNPPFGKKLKIDDESILKKFHLGRKWKKKKGSTRFDRLDVLHDSRPPQILFVERCLALLKTGGRAGIILPESMLCNPSHRHVIQHIKSVGRIVAVVSFPEELFQPYTHAKVCGVLLEKISADQDNPHEIFMAVARWCGHDSRGLLIPHDDIPRIKKKFYEYMTGDIEYDHFGFAIREDQIVDDIYLPKYYNPEVEAKLGALIETHYIMDFGELINRGVIELHTGHEVGKLAYGTGPIPFIRTSDIANWEIKLDPKHCISEDIYESLRERQDVQVGDILMVRDGTYLVGTCAMITEDTMEIVYQSHIYKIRSNDHELMPPALLLAVLSSPIVREQIYAKRFTQDIIDTLGARVRELQLPIPKDSDERGRIIESVRHALALKAEARTLARSAALSVAPTEIELDGSFPTFLG
ncbi:MAG: N-6 DNA methylase [Chloroflexota bacterium]|nr:N-6 DNA methylase [Chloroflexota bacterium]MDE2951147.1 N-6 DNA methylase [Chloroflexota bacterium]